MDRESHIKAANKLLDDSDFRDSSPIPWVFEWDGKTPPTK